MLIDTSGLLCLVDSREARHSDAVALYDHAAFRITHGYVVAEFVPLASSRGFARHVAIGFLFDVINEEDIVIEWPSRSLTVEAMSFLDQRRDKRCSLCDAVSFLLMRRTGVTEALSTDRHFEQEGFTRLLRPSQP